MKIRPIQGNVLLEIYKEEKKVGIIIPDNVYDDEVFLLGKVLDVANDVDLVKKDDLVTFKKHLFDELYVAKNKVYLLGKVENVTSIVEL